MDGGCGSSAPDEAGLNVVDSVIAKDYPDDDAAAECMRLGALLA